ncbi:E3 ubiquitin-protein ligase TRIM71-like [Asterias rubens]|uniref:E3 ubiquitin-protein ligase TRIM71-like n=1 Tax=Asterias rubens TaxID=7604 RepID=UPI0014551477|nr:E3 ubiquitin-protein ligase TRIM71-like [Asterias rubens]XP_033641181.1 E3 ubiquitin-protein ligase TRIM71-like [Asterias rubens]
MTAMFKNAASTVLNKISKESLKCGLCQNFYFKPKIMDCVHTFCEDCLVKYRNMKYPKNTRIPCPVCSDETELPIGGITGLKSNLHLSGVVEEMVLHDQLLGAKGKKLECGGCDENKEAIARCMDCDHFLCQGCVEAHKRFAMIKNHSIATLDELRTGKIELKSPARKKAPECENHPGEKIRCFCETCSELICLECAFLGHARPQHESVSIREAANRRRQSMRDFLPKTEEVVNEFQQVQKGLNTVKNDLKINASDARKSIQELVASKISELRKKEKSLLDEIDHTEKQRAQTMQQSDQKVTSFIGKARHSLEVARNAIETATDSDFLSLHPTVERDLQNLTEKSPPQVHQKLSFLKFTGLAKEAADNVTLGQVVKRGEWDMMATFGKEGTMEGEFKWARGITACPNGDIAVADRNNNRVAVSSSEGNHKVSIPAQSARNVACDSKNRLVVIDRSGLATVYNGDRKQVLQFPVAPSEQGTVDPRCVAIDKEDRIYIGDFTRQLISIHSPIDGKVERIIQVNMKPEFICVTGKNLILMSNADEGKVVAVDPWGAKGNEAFGFETVFEGEKMKPAGIAIDGNDEIYISGYMGYINTGQIHHYTARGKHIKCIADKQYMPQGICFNTKGMLIMANYHSVRIFNMS